MKFGFTRLLFVIALTFTVLYPEMLVSVAVAQDADAPKTFGGKMVAALGIFLYPFIIMVVGGFTLIIYNGIAIRKKAFIKDDVVAPIMQEVQNLNIPGALSLCDQYKLPVTAVLKGGLSRIQDDELDIEQIEKGLEENSGIALSKPFTWINLLNTIGSIAPMIGLLGTVTGMIGAFNVLTESGMGGESSQKMAGNIGSALWTTAAGLVVAIPTLKWFSPWFEQLVEVLTEKKKRRAKRNIMRKPPLPLLPHKWKDYLHPRNCLHLPNSAH
jgi:biopolymer transport protein ExbB